MKRIIQSLSNKNRVSQSIIIHFDSEYSFNTLIKSLQYANPDKVFNTLII